jgi:hypothetical protein
MEEFFPGCSCDDAALSDLCGSSMVDLPTLGCIIRFMHGLALVSIIGVDGAHIINHL